MDAYEIIYKRYVDPVARKARRALVGCEIEMPIARVEDEERSVDLKTVLGILPMAIGRGCAPVLWTRDGTPVNVRDADGTALCFDSSFQNFEFSLAPQATLGEIVREFHRYYALLQSFLLARGHRLLGRGLMRAEASERLPILIKKAYPGLDCRDMPARDIEYQYLLDRCRPPYHEHPDFFAFISSTQLHLDVALAELPLALNVYSRLDGLEMMLFANSRAAFGGQEYLCGRHYLYTQSPMRGLGVVGSVDAELRTVDDLVRLYGRRKIVGRRRDRLYHFLPEPVPLWDYFADPRYEARPEDIGEMFSFTYSECTKQGTIERRAICTQPVDALFLPGAFDLGLRYRLGETDELLRKFFRDQRVDKSNNELCDIAARPEGIAYFGPSWEKLAAKLAELSYDGLKESHPGDEAFLRPIEERIGGFRSPARIRELT